MEEEQKVEKMLEQSQTEDVKRFTFFTLILRTMAGFAGGLAGTIILLIIYLLSASIVAPVLGSTEEAVKISPLFVFVLMAMIFASSLFANLLAPFLISFVQRDRYKRITTTLFQIFILNIIILIILVPIYFVSAGIDIAFASYAAGLQIAFSVIGSALIFEIISNYKYALIGVYASIFAVLAGLGFNIMVYQATGTATILLFIALPVLWAAVGFMYGIIMMVYNWIVSVWGRDYLATMQEFSKDYGVAEEDYVEEEKEPEPVDKEGMEFLKNTSGDETSEGDDETDND